MVQRVQMVRGTTQSFEITITDAEYAPFKLAAGEKILFGVKRKPDDAEYIFLKKIYNGSREGVFNVTVYPEDTADIAPGRYYYDVGAQIGADYYNVIKPSPFDVLSNITKWGDAD